MCETGTGQQLAQFLDAYMMMMMMMVVVVVVVMSTTTKYELIWT
jgi:hypothetical protein